MSIDRRTLLQALAGASALAASGRTEVALAQAAPAITPAQFAALSATLTGYPAGDPSVARSRTTRTATSRGRGT